MLYDSTGSYTPDFAAEIDTEEEILADEIGVSLKQARAIIKFRNDAIRREQAYMLASVIGLLIRSRNMPVMVHSLAIAFGLSDLNGAHSESEIAKQLGVTRALISHYVVGWRDVLAGKTAGFDCLKFRKHNSTRETYKQSATDPFLAKQATAMERVRNKIK